MTASNRRRTSSLRALMATMVLAVATSAANAAGMVETDLTLGGTTYVAEWHVPDGEPRALVTVQHGFARVCANVRGTAQRVAQSQGVATLCLNAPMTLGNPALAELLAAALADGLPLPDARPMPDRIVVGGHSAGGHFASRLGWALASLAPKRLAGAVLFDPVAAGSSFADNLSTLGAAGTRPVRAITSLSHPCNADHNAYAALRRVASEAQGSDTFVGLELTDRSTHVDVEGSDTDLVGIIACEGRPRRANVDALRMLAAVWALDAALGTRRAAYYPGGEVIESLIEAGRAVAIE